MITRVLVGVDFSAASKQALERAGNWATTCGVPLVAMHVLQPPAPMLPEALSTATISSWGLTWPRKALSFQARRTKSPNRQTSGDEAACA